MLADGCRHVSKADCWHASMMDLVDRHIRRQPHQSSVILTQSWRLISASQGGAASTPRCICGNEFGVRHSQSVARDLASLQNRPTGSQKSDVGINDLEWEWMIRRIGSKCEYGTLTCLLAE